MFNADIKNGLKLYLDNALNVCLIGRHGVGKTAVVQKLFTETFGDKWIYLSGATLDPFIDLIGVPLKQEDENGKPYLEFIRPKQLQEDNVHAIFCDEYNRAPKKVKNALLEVIQFKSIQGYKFKNLKVVWTAINPDDDNEYDIEPLDPAQKDRFHIHMELPYLLDKEYFTSMYGEDLYVSSAEWWYALDENIRKQISPRRLDYAIQVWKINGNIRDVIPKQANVSKLLENLKKGSLSIRIEKLLKETNEEVIRQELSVNEISYIQKHLSELEYIDQFLKFLPEELILKEAPDNYTICDYINKNKNNFSSSLISTLENQGLFIRSAFEECFKYYQKYFSDDSYYAKRKNQLKYVLNTFPDVNTIKITSNDIPKIEKILNIINIFLGTAYQSTISKMENSSPILQKLYNLYCFNNSIKNPALQIDYSKYSHIKYKINNIIKNNTTNSNTIDIESKDTYSNNNLSDLPF